MSDQEERERSAVLLLCGPTAVGKTAVALELAEELNGEIVSVDSMQVYQGMDIGTAKPPPEERARVPHHLIDILQPHEAFDAAAFLKAANAAVADIRSRGRMPILCGGTGLYLKAFISGLGDSPPADAELRDRLSLIPLPELLAELQAKDPSTFDRIDRQNPRRVIRAVEVIRLTGRPFSEQRRNWAQARTDLACVTCGLSREPGDLRRRINARVDDMFRLGLVREAAELLKRGLDQNTASLHGQDAHATGGTGVSPVAMQALGYRQVIEHLRGERTLEETIALVKIRSWQFARRQMTWFRGQLRPEWIHVKPQDSAADTARAVRAIFEAGKGRAPTPR